MLASYPFIKEINVSCKRSDCMKSAIEKLDKTLANIERPIMFISGLLLFVLMTWCVITRYFFHISTPYQTELAQTFHIWLCFIGSSYLFSLNANPSVEIFSDKVMHSKNILFKKVYFTIVWLLNLVFIFPCLYYAILNIPKYTAQVTAYLGYSYIWVYGAGIVGFGLMLFRIFLRIAGFWSGLYLETYQDKTDEIKEVDSV